MAYDIGYRYLLIYSFKLKSAFDTYQLLFGCMSDFGQGYSRGGKLEILGWVISADRVGVGAESCKIIFLGGTFY